MKTPNIASLTAMAALLVLLAGCREPGADEQLAEARKAIAGADWKAAQIRLKSALQQQPKMAEARYLLGQVLFQAGDAQGALVELDKAAEAGFPLDRMADLHARVLLARRESRKLIDTYGQTQLADPAAQSALLVSLGEAQLRTDQAEAARASLERAVQLQPGSETAEVALARLDASQGRSEAASRRIEALLGSKPQAASAWKLKGDMALAARADPAKARDAYEKAVKADPKAADAQLALIGLLLSQRDTDAAERQLAAAREQLGAGNLGLRYFGAAVELERGRLDAAHEQAQALLKQLNEDPRVFALAGQIEFLRDNFLGAESNFSRAVALGAGGRTRLMLAQTYLRLDDSPRALQALQPLLDDAANPQARAHALAGEALLQQGETRKAEEQFKRAAQLDPKDARSRTLLALGQVGQGRPEQGVGELRELSDSFESPLADLALVSTFTRKGDYAAALKAIEGIERKLPDRGIAPTLRAQVFRAQGQPEQARAALEEALKRDPKYLPAALQLARDLLQAGKPQDAVARVASVAKADPGNVLTQLAWLNLRLQAGEGADAVEKDLQALVKQHPEVARARAALVRSQLRRGDLSAAAATAQQAVAALPTEAEPLELLAEVQMRQRETTLALKSYEKLAELRPRSPETLLRLAEVQRQAERPREALATVKKALQVRANHGPALRQQVLLEAELGNVAAARRLVKDMGQLPGLEAMAAATEGDLETGQQQFDVAASAYRRALARNAALPELPARLHRVLVASGKTAEAEAFARDWLKEHPRDVGLLNYLGDIALNAGQLPQARQHYERSLALASAQPLVLNNLAWVALQTKDLAKAETWIAEAMRLAPGEAALLDTQSALQSARGQHDAAQATQRQALQLDGSPALRVNLARRYIAAGRKDAARDELLAVQQLRDRYPGQAEVTALLASL